MGQSDLNPKHKKGFPKIPLFTHIYSNTALINQLITVAHLPLFTHGYHRLLVITQTRYILTS